MFPNVRSRKIAWSAHLSERAAHSKSDEAIAARRARREATLAWVAARTAADFVAYGSHCPGGSYYIRDRDDVVVARGFSTFEEAEAAADRMSAEARA